MIAPVASLVAVGILGGRWLPVTLASVPPTPYMVLEKTGGYAVGGTRIADPSGTGETLSCDHGYAEYFIPAAPRRQTSILLMHSSSTQVYQNRWDGGTGFKDLLLRRGYPVFLLDQPGVGRASWSCDQSAYVPRYLDRWNFPAWNFGPSYGEWWAGTQFPIGTVPQGTKPTENGTWPSNAVPAPDQLEKTDPVFRRAYDQAMRARYFKPNSTHATLLAADAVTVGVDGGMFGVGAALAQGAARTFMNADDGGVVIIANAGAGLQALLAAVKSVSSRIRAILAFECIGYVFPEGDSAVNATEAANTDPGPFGPFVVPRSPDFARLLKIPTVFYWSHNRSETWDHVVKSRQLTRTINELGGNAEVVVLDEIGFPGSTHVTVADMNNEALVGLVDKFLEKHKLDGYGPTE